MRNFKVVAALAAVLCVTLAVGGGIALAQQSGKDYVCAYGKQVSKNGRSYGNVYMVLAVSPKSFGPSKCKAFNSSFKGTKEHLPQKLGTGKMYCKFITKNKDFSIFAAGMADSKALGKGFCTGIKKTLGTEWKTVK